MQDNNKMAEAAAESVATIAGPELYSNVKFDEKGRNTCWITEEPEEMMKASMQLIRNKNHRIKQVIAAHKEVSSKWNLKTRIDERITLYRELWQRRMKIDRKLVERMENQGVCLKTVILFSNLINMNWHKIAKEFQASGRLDEAENAYLESLKLCPKNVDSINNLSIVMRKKNEIRKAEELLKKDLEILEELWWQRLIKMKKL